MALSKTSPKGTVFGGRLCWQVTGQVVKGGEQSHASFLEPAILPTQNIWFYISNFDSATLIISGNKNNLKKNRVMGHGHI